MRRPGGRSPIDDEIKETIEAWFEAALVRKGEMR